MTDLATPTKSVRWITAWLKILGDAAFRRGRSLGPLGLAKAVQGSRAGHGPTRQPGAKFRRRPYSFGPNGVAKWTSTDKE